MKSDTKNLNIAQITQPLEVQKAFWIQSQSTLNTDPGSLSVKFELHGAINIDLLQNAWQTVVARHDMLRATINTNAKGSPLLVIHKNREVAAHFKEAVDKFPSVDLSLDKLPSNKLFHRRVAEEQIELCWHCHHALLDGWSSQLVLQDFIDTYNALRATGESNSIEKPAQADYIQIHRSLLHEDTEQACTYWRSTLNQYNHPALLAHSASGSNKIINKTAVSLLANDDTVSEISALCKNNNVTTASLIQLLWATILGRLNKQQDIVIGLATSGRATHIQGIESAIGPLAQVCPMRLQLDNDTSLHELVAITRNRQFDALQYQHIGLQKIQTMAEPACRHRLFDSLLVIENLPMTTAANAEHPNDNVRLLAYQSEIVSTYPLTITVIPAENWQIRIDYDESRFTEQWIDSLQKVFSTAVKKTPEHWHEKLDKTASVLDQFQLDHPDKRAFELRNTTDQFRNEFIDTLIGPKNQLELELIAIWEDTLQVRPISMNSGFYDIGGSSLLALQLVQSIKTKLQADLPVSLFFSNPTPALCAQALEDQKDSIKPIPYVIGFNSQQNKPGLFCLHAGGGHAMFYKDFAQYLSVQTPCYAIQPKGIDGKEEPLTTIEQMASFYIAEIKKVQPRGPYHLLCYCFGGALILEMTNQLKAQNDEVGCLIIADAPSPVPASHPMAKIGWKPYLLYEYFLQQRWDYLYQAAMTQLEKLNYVIRSNNKTLTDDDSIHNYVARVQTACEISFTNYRAKAIEHPVFFINAEDSDSRFSNAVYMRNWKRLTPNLSHHYVKGDHRTIFNQPYVHGTAQVVSEIISCYQKDHTPTEWTTSITSNSLSLSES